MRFDKDYHNDLARFPINTPERTALFAAARLRGQDTVVARITVIEALLAKAAAPASGYGYPNFDRRKMTIKFPQVTRPSGNYLTKVFDSYWFTQHKKDGDFGWEAIARHAQKIGDYYANREKQRADEKRREEKTAKLQDAACAHAKARGAAALMDRICTDGHGTVYIKLPLADVRHAKEVIDHLLDAKIDII